MQNGTEPPRMLLHQIYTGAGFDATRTGTTDGAGTTSASVEMDVIPAGMNYDVCKIDILVSVAAGHLYGNGDYPIVAVEVKPIGGAYGALISFDPVLKTAAGNNYQSPSAAVQVLSYYYEVTPAMKASGYQLRITGSAVVNDARDTTPASVTNLQTTIFLMRM